MMGWVFLCVAEFNHCNKCYWIGLSFFCIKIHQFDEKPNVMLKNPSLWWNLSLSWKVINLMKTIWCDEIWSKWQKLITVMVIIQCNEYSLIWWKFIGVLKILHYAENMSIWWNFLSLWWKFTAVMKTPPCDKNW